MGRLDVHIRHGGGDGETLAVVALAVGVAAVLIHEAWHTIIAIWHVVVTVLEVIAWTVGGIAGAAALTGAAVAGVRIRRAVRRARASRAAVARPVVTITPEGYARPAAARAERPAIAAPRPAGSWPLPGWWEEIRPRIGGDSDEHRPR